MNQSLLAGDDSLSTLWRQRSDVTIESICPASLGLPDADHILFSPTGARRAAGAGPIRHHEAGDLIARSGKQVCVCAMASDTLALAAFRVAPQPLAWPCIVAATSQPLM